MNKIALFIVIIINLFTSFAWAGTGCNGDVIIEVTNDPGQPVTLNSAAYPGRWN